MENDPPAARAGPQWALRIAVGFLVVLGFASAAFRAVAVIDPDGTVVRLERRLFRSLNDDEAQIRQYEARLADHPVWSLLHVLPGALFLTLGPLQFSAHIRARHPRFHRWSGRLLVTAAIAGVVSSAYFGIVHPIGGLGEASSIAVFGALMVIAVLCGFVAIRRGDVAAHRRWMVRAFSLALGVSTIRVIGGILQASFPMSPASIITISFWAGWSITLGAGELWIRSTARSSTVPGRGPLLASEVQIRE